MILDLLVWLGLWSVLVVDEGPPPECEWAKWSRNIDQLITTSVRGELDQELVAQFATSGEASLCKVAEVLAEVHRAPSPSGQKPRLLWLRSVTEAHEPRRAGALRAERVWPARPRDPRTLGDGRLGRACSPPLRLRHALPPRPDHHSADALCRPESGILITTR